MPVGRARWTSTRLDVWPDRNLPGIHWLPGIHSLSARRQHVSHAVVWVVCRSHPAALMCRFRLRARYRKAALGEERELVVRCSVDAVMHLKGQEQLVSVKALNEFDPKCALLSGAQQSPRTPCTGCGAVWAPVADHALLSDLAAPCQ